MRTHTIEPVSRLFDARKISKTICMHASRYPSSELTVLYRVSHSFRLFVPRQRALPHHGRRARPHAGRERRKVRNQAGWFVLLGQPGELLLAGFCNTAAGRLDLQTALVDVLFELLVLVDTESREEKYAKK